MPPAAPSELQEDLDMSKQKTDDIVQQFRDAPRLDPSGQPRSNSGIADQEGGSRSGPGRASPIGGPPVAERVGGFNDRQVRPAELPNVPSSTATVGGAAKPPKG
jgi:hypothetical protein